MALIRRLNKANKIKMFKIVLAIIFYYINARIESTAEQYSMYMKKYIVDWKKARMYYCGDFRFP
jgi:hypothetical protein